MATQKPKTEDGCRPRAIRTHCAVRLHVSLFGERRGSSSTDKRRAAWKTNHSHADYNRLRQIETRLCYALYGPKWNIKPVILWVEWVVRRRRLPRHRSKSSLIFLFTQEYKEYRNHRRRWGQNHRGSGDGSPPAGSRGRAPVGGLGDEVPQKLKNFWNSYKQILRIFGSISHIFTYICLCFFPVLAGIIPLSPRNGWGHLIPFDPLSTSGGNCPLCPRLRRHDRNRS